MGALAHTACRPRAATWVYAIHRTDERTSLHASPCSPSVCLYSALLRSFPLVVVAEFSPSSSGSLLGNGNSPHGRRCSVIGVTRCHSPLTLAAAMPVCRAPCGPRRHYLLVVDVAAVHATTKPHPFQPIQTKCVHGVHNPSRPPMTTAQTILSIRPVPVNHLTACPRSPLCPPPTAKPPMCAPTP